MHEKIVKFSIIMCWLGIFICYAWAESMNLPTLHIDGAFQTASNLYRLDAGQYPGKDFFPYLGIGPILFLLPLFKLCGSNLFASVFSTYMMLSLVSFLSISFMFHLIKRPMSFLTSMVIGGGLFSFFILVYTASPALLPSRFSFTLFPGTSLRPIRIGPPYFIAIIYYFYLLNMTNQHLKYLLCGFLTGLTILWSNDFSFSTACLFGILILCTALYKNEFKLKYICIYCLSSIGTGVILLTITTYGHPLEFLKYNFIDIAQDQWWYFSDYNKESRLFSLSQINLLLKQIKYDTWIGFTLTLILAFRTRALEHILLLWIGIGLFAGGMIASIGGHLGPYYFDGFRFWGSMTTIFIPTCFLWDYLNQKIKINAHSVAIFYTMFFAAISCVVALGIKLHNNISTAQQDSNRFYVKELGGYLKSEWKDYITLARNTNEENVFEEYWGIWSATRKILPRWPIDSVIHALGSTRKLAEEKLKDANIIISTRNSFSPEWQSWSFSQNYWFYKPLLETWTPMAVSPTTIVWNKTISNTKPPQTENCTVSDDAQSLIITKALEGIYEIKLNYNLSGNGRSLLLIQNNISYGGDADGYVSTDPNAIEVTFPTYIEKPGETRLSIKVIQENEHNLTIAKCFAKYLPNINREVFKNKDKSNEH